MSVSAGDGLPVGVALGVERTHVVDLLEVDVGEDQLVVGGVDDGGPVGAGEHVGGGQGPEGPQHSGLGAQGDLLAFAQGAWWKENEVMVPLADKVLVCKISASV